MINDSKIIIIALLILLAVNVSISSATINIENTVQSGTNCELIAKYYAVKYHTDIYIIQPIGNNGALELCQYCGHIINSKVINGHRYFFDFNEQYGDNIFSSEQQVKDWYGKWDGRQSEIYNTKNTPFPMMWNY